MFPIDIVSIVFGATRRFLVPPRNRAIIVQPEAAFTVLLCEVKAAGAAAHHQ